MTAHDHRVSVLTPVEPPDADLRPRRVDRGAVQSVARELLRASPIVSLAELARAERGGVA
jgi:hypothetical protein